MEGSVSPDTAALNKCAAAKRKAEEEVSCQKTEKKGRVTFTPSAPAKTSKRATPARTKAKAAMSNDSQKDLDASRTMERLFKDLGESLTTSLTKKMSDDFKESMIGVNERINKTRNKSTTSLQPSGALNKHVPRARKNSNNNWRNYRVPLRNGTRGRQPQAALLGVLMTARSRQNSLFQNTGRWSSIRDGEKNLTDVAGCGWRR